jgi:hypothetical protein
MIVFVPEGTVKSKIDAVLKSLEKLKAYISQLDGKKHCCGEEKWKQLIY